MNEKFAADPAYSVDWRDLKYLIDRFGPFSGRYLSAYPGETQWRALVKEHTKDWSDMAQQRVARIIEIGIQSGAIIRNEGLNWDPKKAWIDNAIKEIRSSRKLAGIVVGSGTLNGFNELARDLENWDLAPTAEERIRGVPEEYVRVSETLILISAELGFIDPYLNPCDPPVSSVLGAMLPVVAKGRCKNLRIWTREKGLLAKGGRSAADAKEALRHIRRKCRIQDRFSVELNIVDDTASKERMHGRYILSAKGGIRFDQGFQSLPSGRKVDVGPIGRHTHQELVRVYMENAHDMRIVEQFKFPRDVSFKK